MNRTIYRSIDMQKQLAVYGLFDDNDAMVFKGNVKEVTKHLNITASYLYEHLRTEKMLKGKYKVKRVGESFYEVERKPYKKHEKKEKQKDDFSLEKPIDYLLWHLRIYGNTSTSYNPVPYLPELLDEGLNCRVKEIFYAPERKVKGRRRKPEKYYYIEVVK